MGIVKVDGAYFTRDELQRMVHVVEKRDFKRILQLNDQLDKALKAADEAVAIAEKLEIRNKQMEANQATKNCPYRLQNCGVCP